MPLPAPRRSPPTKGSWTPVPAKCTAVGRFWAPVFLGPEGRAVSLVGAAVPAVRHPAESPPPLGEDRRAGELCCPLRSSLSLGFLRGGAGLGGVACCPPVWAGWPPRLHSARSVAPRSRQLIADLQLSLFRLGLSCPLKRVKNLELAVVRWNQDRSPSPRLRTL